MRKVVPAVIATIVTLVSIQPVDAKSPGNIRYSFSGTDGATPMARLVADKSGNLYGTTQFGGDATHCGFGCGTVFKIARDGTETVLHAFELSDGAAPVGGLTLGVDGTLYGTTSAGGSAANCPKPGCGLVFAIAPGGSYSILYTFGTTRTDGGDPMGGLIFGHDGNLYGTTASGGDAGRGTVFKITPDGTESMLHSFAGITHDDDGMLPSSELVMDAAGNLYGTTLCGGDGNQGGSACESVVGAGTIFKLAPDGTETVLHSFFGNGDGELPRGGLLLDSAGNLFGTAYAGNTAGDLHGVVYKLASDGTYSTLYSFSGGDGANPVGTPIADVNGNLYGVTAHGGGTKGHGGSGVVFKLAPNGTETVLYKLGGHHGAVPGAGLFADKAFKHLYGVASQGGASQLGTVFTVKP
jgi:uncharacterized repeat protein (TIGR03803 family)